MRAALVAAVLALAACDGPVATTGNVDAQWQGDPQFTRRYIPADLPAFFDCLRVRGATIVSAHRGGPVRGFAENAISTFENTLAQAPAFLEVDVARTRDGVLVLMHDETVDRTTTGTGNVSALTAAEFTALSLQDEDGATLDAHSPTLRQALDWANGRAVLELDVKRSVSYEDVAREVEAANAIDRVVFITYSVDGASRLARVAPQATIYTTITNTRDLDTLERRGVDLRRIVAWLGTQELDATLVEALEARGVEGRWGRFDRNADFAAAAEAGIEGVAVNDAAAAFRAIDAADGEDGYAALQCVSAP
jgi:glycerophosphoryl diester phosphodiesterase